MAVIGRQPSPAPMTAADAASAVIPSVVSDKANSSTGFFDLPAGTTAQRPGSPTSGNFRLNTTTGYLEYHNGAAWIEVTVFSPASISGLIGWYDMSSISGSNWNDKSGQANHATLVNSPAVVTTSGNGASLLTQALHGSTITQGVYWPSAILPSNHTLFHVTRYTGSNNLRIYQTEGVNYLSGFWNGFSGVAYHNAWVTQSSSSVHGNNWVISTDQWDTYRSNGISRKANNGGARSTARLAINAGSGLSEFGMWMTAECIVYNRELSTTELQQVEQYLAAKYGIALG